MKSETTEKHKKLSSNDIACGVITLSDSITTDKDDLSGQYLADEISKRYTLKSKTIIPDDKESLIKTIKEMINKNIDVILTTGGTGFSKRDITPEATKSVIEREALGIVEAIRFYSLQITKRAMLSRATSGIRQNTLIINLPGSPKACKEALDFVLDDVKHGIEILLGEAKECARK